MDLSKNYTFHVQDEAQGYYWTHNSCTVQGGEAKLSY